jgi:type IV pilus assembly protein PilX
MPNPTHSPGGRQQRGWILVIGLVVLVMLSIIAIALMRTTMMEEKMAGANRDINLSFEAAETALRGAEIFIENQSDDSLFATTGTGLYAQGTSDDDIERPPFELDSWKPENNHSIALSSAPVGVTSAPRYMIKKVGESGDEGSLNLGGYGETDLSQKSVIYRITARGTGGNDSTQTVLRSHYARAY